jgi:hypothetical protein
MKTMQLLLGGSLLANAVLAVIVLTRSSEKPASSTSIATTSASIKSTPTKNSALEAALISGDPAALAAAGCPPEIVRIFSIGRNFEAATLKGPAARRSSDPLQYWKPPKQEAVWAIEALEAHAMRELRIWGELKASEARYSILPPKKQARLNKIEQDYGELELKAYASFTKGVELPSDREKLALIRQEKERDIAAILTAEDREQLELHDSATAQLIRRRYGVVIETEEQYKKIYALQKAFEERFNVIRSPAPREASQAHQQEIRALLTPEQIATLELRADADRNYLPKLAERLNLPVAPTTDAVLAMRDRYAARSLEVNADASLSAEQRRSQLQALATAGQAELAGALGTQAAEIYGKETRWMTILKNGNAFSTDPKIAPPTHDTLSEAVFMVPAPGAAGRRGGRGN